MEPTLDPQDTNPQNASHKTYLAARFASYRPLPAAPLFILSFLAAWFTSPSHLPRRFGKKSPLKLVLMDFI
jgi:hypothetical protein